MTWTITHIASQDPGKTTPRIADERYQPVAYVLQADKAALLAAAPELLEALNRLLGQCERLRLPDQPPTGAEINAIAVLKKATQ